MIDYSKIKLIVWDMDDTFWTGTLSEGAVSLSLDNIQLLKDSTDCGVINTICSKNNARDVMNELKKHDIAEYFVFNSINYEPKGQRIKTMLQDMALRAPNVLFIDDNISNLKEALFYNPGLMIADPSIIKHLGTYFSQKGKKDSTHKRLAQYKVLEQKRLESKEYSSNEDFLYSCDIHIQIKTNCLDVESRLFELTQRTNQLNFTKDRPSKSEFNEQLKYCDTCGYIEVQDRFGDYGIVGLFVLKDSKFIHFLFSCRTIGQGIEQYVYWKLGFPELKVVGDVATKLNRESKPGWIKEGIRSDNDSQKSQFSEKLLFKGPCDMSSVVGYLQLNDALTTEFTFTDDDGHLIESHNHSAHIAAIKLYKNSTLDTLKRECFFLHDSIFTSSIFNDNYKIIFLSTLIEGNYGLYRRKGTGEIVSFGHFDYPLTDKRNWDGYVNGSILNFGYKITRNTLEQFSQNYEFLGRTTPEQYKIFVENLISWLPENTHLCLILGSEIKYNQESMSTYMDRHLWHKDLNNAIAQIQNPRLHWLNMTKYIKSQSDFTNNINHFTPSVYYKLSCDIKSLINELCSSTIRVHSNWKRYLVKQYIMPVVSKVLPKNLFWKIHHFFRSKI